MGLFGPIWMTDKPRKKAKALAFVNGLTNQTELDKIAREAPLDEVAMAACRRIDDQEILEGIVRSWIKGSDQVHLTALEGISDETRVARLASTLNRGAVRAAAIDKLANPDPVELHELFDKATKQEDEETEKAIERAMARVRDHKAIMAYFTDGVKIEDPVRTFTGWSGWLDLLTKEELLELFGITTVDGYWHVAGWVAGQVWERLAPKLTEAELLRIAEDDGRAFQREACGRVGHERGERCVCTRCGAQLPHEIVGDTCRFCGGHREVEVETGPWEPVYSNFDIYDADGVKVADPRSRETWECTYLAYADGTRELVDKEYHKETSWKR